MQFFIYPENIGLGNCTDEAAEDFAEVVDDVKSVVEHCPCVEKSKDIVGVSLPRFYGKPSI